MNKLGNQKILGITILVFFLIVAATAVTLFLRKDKHNSATEFVPPNPEFAAYIGSFTSGHISSHSTIKIRLNTELQKSVALNTPIEDELFEFSPSIAGHAEWRDAQTIEFIPDQPLTSSTLYEAEFHLGKLIEVKEELKIFKFQFQIIEQSLQLQMGDLFSYHSNDFSFYNFTGTLSTADVADAAAIEKCLNFNFAGRKPSLRWTHDVTGYSHQFVIDSISRSDSKELLLQVNADGNPLGVKWTQNVSQHIPAKNVFELLSVDVVAGAEAAVKVNFSNPLLQSQSLEGLLRLEGASGIKYIINTNQVLIYPENTGSGTFQLFVDAALKDAKGKLLGKSSQHAIVFSQLEPSIRFTGNGNILPSTSGMQLAFETVNLNAVDVKVVKIYANNVLQFLQSNDLRGGSQLSQVGKKIVQKKISLGVTNPAELGSWHKFSLDLSTLIKSEPGAIYRVTLSAKRAYSTYPCGGAETSSDSEMEALSDNSEKEEPNYFGYYDEDNAYYSDEDYYDDYNWSDRDDPCKSTYYKQSERIVSRNILASDLGITLKKGNDGSVFVAASDLITAKSLANVQVELYDFQKQLIFSAQTDEQGFCSFQSPSRPYFLVAKKEKMFSYIRIEDGASLSLSAFDVSGESVNKGIKGFIYGERGVWRPGDSLFLGFILEDKAQHLPAEHPVIFELFNPQGQLYRRMASTKGINGMYAFKPITDKNAPTGLWSAIVKVGGLKFQKSIRIENIQPNRLKIDLKIGTNDLIMPQGNNVINLHSNWLTGATASSLDAKINVALSAYVTEFPKYKGFIFDDPTRRFEAQNSQVFEGKLNETGDAKTPFDVEIAGAAPGFLKATFNTMVFEPGGAFSVDRYSATYSPYLYYTGIKLPEAEKNTGILYTKRDHMIDIATVDAKGNAVSRSELKVEVYKLEWRWWWDQYNDELANYTSDSYHKTVYTQVLSSSNGRASFKLNIPDDKWGRYLIRVTDVAGGHSSSVVTYFDWANWMERGGDGDSKVMSNMLTFSSDKGTYKTGEEAVITLPAPKNGRALITVENGSKVLQAQWLETTEATTKFKLKITPEMAPNVYLHVSLLQPHSRSNDLPMRSYGVIPLTVDNPETHLKPVIQAPAMIEPEQNLSVTVSEADSREMGFTIAVVEEGLLDITRFKTPDPYGNFYSKEALGVKTWDVFDDVIGAYGTELERILSIGGDGSEMDNDGAKANRFKPVVRFFGPYKLAAGEKKVISFKMPMYVGAVRTMVIAAHKGAYASAEQSTKVKAPLMVLGTLPRVLSVGEQVSLPVSVFGGDKAPGKTEVRIEVNGLLTAVGGVAQSAVVGKDDEKMVAFNLNVGNRTGIAKVRITANGGGHKASFDLELDVRNPNPYSTKYVDYTIEAGKSMNATYEPYGLPGTNTGTLEVSSLPTMNLNKRLSDLLGYPHGCVEQTTSKAFAQLYLGNLTDLTSQQKAALEQNIKGGIAELQKFQLSNGGMSYWQGLPDANQWGTNYSGHFLLLAEKEGYTLPNGMMKKWITFQTNEAQNFDLSDARIYSRDQIQAYRLYVLALAKVPVLSAMNRLREYPKLTQLACWLLADAYAQMGQTAEAEALIRKGGTAVEDYHYNYYTYGSSERDQSIVLETYCLLNKKSEAISQLRKVAASLATENWMSTQSTAFCLHSVAMFVKTFGGSTSMQATANVNGASQTLKGNGISQVPLSFKGTSNSFNIQNNGKGNLFVRLINRGKAPIGDEQEASSGLQLSVSYKDMNGNTIQPSELEQGTNFLMSVTVRNVGTAGEVRDLALNCYIPSGWEIHNARMDDNEAAMKNSVFTYQDIKDDKVLTYFDLRSSESKTFNVLLNASYVGQFYLPAITTEAMYDNSVYARTKGQWIKVLKKNQGKVAAK
jgi:hypothetical protein